jgi:Domain of unknown function (DUF4157)
MRHHVSWAITVPLRSGVRGLLQRKCACGAGARLTAECAECSENKAAGLQTKLRVNAPGDAYEQEADRVAEQVMAEPAHAGLTGTSPSLQRFSAQSDGQMAAAPASVEHVLSDPGTPLEPPLRQEMERRFAHDFSQVRVHSGPAADQSTRDVSANAYTVGHDIAFAAGRYAPQTHQGRRLIAHELTHVVQQSGNAGTSVGRSNDKRDLSPVSLPIIQRQPEGEPARKTLKSEGVDVKDPVAESTASIIDRVVARNEKLAPYIGDRLKGGFKIAEKGKFVHDSSDGNFDAAYRKAYELSSADTVSKDTKGFFDPRTSEIHLRPDAEFGTALHESVHRLASPALYNVYLQKALRISTDLVETLKEGVTAFFTDSILADEKLPKFIDAYPRQKKKAAALIAALGSDGFGLMATFNFKGTGVIEIGEKLGFSRKQFGAAGNDAIPEVLKRMANSI